MKYYENGEIWTADQHVGRHKENISDLVTLTDERGTYAPMTAGNPGRSAVFFADAEKQAGFILGRLCKFDKKGE